MKNFSFLSLGLIFLCILCNSTACGLFKNSIDEDEIPDPVVLVSDPSLSPDQKEILRDSTILLSIDNDQIFEFFQQESNLCDEYNISTSPERKLFCEDKTTFLQLTRFRSIVLSPDAKMVGFTIESDVLEPDSMVGIFYPDKNENQLSILTNYAIGNEFLSFSPDNLHFVYKSACFEGNCSLFVLESNNLNQKIVINEPTDEKNADANFIQWLSNNELEYSLESPFGNENQTISF